MTTCPACQASLPEGSAFCPRCGASVSSAAAAVMPSREPNTSGLTIAAFVLSFIPFCFLNVVGLILGIVSLRRIQANPAAQGGRGLAIASIIVGSCTFLVVTLGIMAAIAIPSFLKYQARSRQSEARVTLASMRTAIHNSRADKGTSPASFKEMGIEWHEGPRTYAFFYKNDAIQPTHGGPYAIPAEIAAQRESLDVIAVGNIDGDPELDVWTVDTNGVIEHPIDDLAFRESNERP